MAQRKTDPPRGLLKTVTDSDNFRHERYLPSADLAPYIEHYWAVEWDFRGESARRAESLPHPCVHMVFDERGEASVMGPMRARFCKVLEGKGRVFAAKFTPGGFHPFAGAPVSRFSETSVSLKTVFGTPGVLLRKSVFAQANDDARIHAIEQFFRERRPVPDPQVDELTKIVYAVAKERGILSVDDLVARYGLEKRTLQRLFAKYVGVSPKWVIQRYRLHEAAAQLKADRSVSHAELAQNLGYSDQAHFIRDFKSIVGVSPAAYAKSSMI